jgi:hypothetical protein
VIRSSIFSSLLLSLVLVAGCQKDPPQTTPPGDGPQVADADDGKKPRGKKGGDKTDPEGETPSADETDPTKKVCPAETADFPEPYFGQTVLLRLPKNVTGDNFVEMQPGLATLSGDVESVSCIPDSPGAMITHMALASFPEDAAKDMLVWRDELIEAFGYGGATISGEKHDAAKRYYQAVIELPAAEGAEPAKALFQAVAANGFMYAIVMETHPEAWNAMKETFYKVGEQMRFLKP